MNHVFDDRTLLPVEEAAAAREEYLLIAARP